MSTPEGTGPRWPLRPAGMTLLALAAVAALIGLVLTTTENGPTSADGQLPATTEQPPGAESPSPPAGPPPPAASPTISPAPPGTPAPPSPGPASPTPATPGPASPGPIAPAPGPAVPGPAAPGPGPAAPAPAESEADIATSGKGEGRSAVRVYNNSTIPGLAARAAEDLTAAGWTVVEVGNYSRGRIPTSTVYYQEGTDQRATAEAIGAEFGMRIEPRFPGIAHARPGTIVIVTNDYGTS